MVPASVRNLPRPLHALHAVLVAAAAPLFLGGLLGDIGYARTYQVQWANFAAWLIAGGMVFTGMALVLSLVQLLQGPARRGRPLIVLLLLLAMFVIGLLNSFMHARDAWGAMPSGLVMSVVVAALAVAAIWFDAGRSATDGAAA